MTGYGGKHALITRGSSGIGFAIARRLVDAGGAARQRGQILG